MDQARGRSRSRCRAREWQIPVSATVMLFCAKLQPWKGPGDALEAFARANVPNSYLVFAGDGPLRTSIEQRADELGVSERVRILGFVNQSQLPSVYCAADLLVLPSLYEPFGFVVNEAMLCGCPVAVSDRVGAKYDLVRQGETGYVFPTGDVDALAAILVTFCQIPTSADRWVRLPVSAWRLGRRANMWMVSWKRWNWPPGPAERQGKKKRPNRCRC